MNIIQKFINYNRTKAKRVIKYICIHDTGNSSAGANAEMHYRFFNSANRNASADFFVDDKQILQIVDSDNYYSWAVGDGRGKYGITNANSISIEICINSDSNYQKTLQKTIELTKYLMSKYKIPIERVVRHYDASRKNCPGTFSANNWAKWWWFKKQLQESSNTPSDKPSEISPPPEWKLEGLSELHKEGLVNDYEQWKSKLDKSMPVWACMLIMYRIFKALKK